MANQIVQVNVSQQLAPTPSKLQKTGAFISQGGTTTAPGSLTLITQLADLTAILSSALAISAISWTASVVTVTTTVGHGWTIGDTVPIVIAGVTPVGYNGSFIGSVIDANTITYPLVANPGSETVLGTIILGDVPELLSMGTTFFAQGSQQAVYVLELGEGTVDAGVTALQSYITANPNKVYSYLVPREWDNNTSFKAFLANFESTTAKTYFFITTTVGTYNNYPLTMKDVFLMVEAPSIPATEFSTAAPFFVTLNYAPSSSNKVTPLSFAYLVGVTDYPLPGNGSLLATLKTANVNYVGTGAEGGLSNTILFWGRLRSGDQYNYWYSVDWAQINIEQALTNAVISGSNNPLAPLLYNQQGINVLQDRAAQVISNAVTYGLATGTVVKTTLPADQFAQNFQAGVYRGKLVINAEPFLVYTAENPNDYGIGRYAGLAMVYTSARGFEQIIVNLTATNFI
jgi:hypothetical protein